MDTVRRGLLQRQPGLEERLLPVHYDDFDQVEIEPDIEQKWNEIEETHGHLGIQYPVLASYAREHDLDKLELSVEARSEEESTIIIVTPWFVYTTKILIERGSQKKENTGIEVPPPIDRGRARAREKARQDLS
jgi:hypothetical protein